MEQTSSLQQVHTKLRRKYSLALTLFFLVLTFGLLSLIILEYIFSIHVFKDDLHIYLISGGVLFYVIFGVVFFTTYAKRLQKRLLLIAFAAFRKKGLTLAPNPRGGQDFPYSTLLRENTIVVKGKIDVLTRYEISGRLAHVLHFKGANPTVIIHIPFLESPYYFQINNGNFAPPEMYKDQPVSKISFVSQYRLNYYLTNASTSAKIVLRQQMETKFVKFLELSERKYAYILTYQHEFLLIDKFLTNNELKLMKKYPSEHYVNIYNDLKYMETLMKIMLEKRR